MPAGRKTERDTPLGPEINTDLGVRRGVRLSQHPYSFGSCLYLIRVPLVLEREVSEGPVNKSAQGVCCWQVLVLALLPWQGGVFQPRCWWVSCFTPAVRQKRAHGFHGVSGLL